MNLLRCIADDGKHLTEQDVVGVIQKSFDGLIQSSTKILVIIPDGTRTAPIPMFFKLLYRHLRKKVSALDFLIALGTHQPMTDIAINRLLGITAKERSSKYTGSRIFNHQWDSPSSLAHIGTIGKQESRKLSREMLELEVPVRINKLLLDYDLLVVCGPVFPHEVVGFSGGSKYFSPGVGGPEIIDFTHWLGALITSYEIIGTKDTPVRDVIERVAEMIPVEKLALCMVAGHDGLKGLFAGDMRESWSAAADLSAQCHIRFVDKPFHTVVSIMPEMYDDLWTGAKGMYKMEPVVADGGEIIIFAPHITEISYTHGKLIDQIGYHVRDYFVKQWDEFNKYPWGVLAHSTHLSGIGTFENNSEKRRVRVVLATGIPEQRCKAVNLAYMNPDDLDIEAMKKNQCVLVVPEAGELLYRLKR